MALTDIVVVNISASSAAPTRQGFGTPLIAAALVPWAVASPDVVRSYSGIAGMVADGFATSDPAYRAAQAMFSQTPRVKRVKIGKRALAFTQLVDLTPAAPSTGLVYAITIDGALVTYTAIGGDTLASVNTALAAAVNTALAALPSAIILTGASTAGIQNLTGASLNGAVGAGVMNPPRALQGTFSANANWLASTMTVTGTDNAGNIITDTILIAAGGATTVNAAGAKRFRTVTNVNIPAQGGVAGTFTLGQRARATAAAVGGTKVTVTTTLPGELVPYSGRSATLLQTMTTADPGIATDLAAIRLADNDFYGLVLDSNGALETLAAAAWAEATPTLFVAQSADTGCIDGAVSTDVASLLKAASYTHTAPEWHPEIGTLTSWLAAGLAGNRLPDDPGSDTWAYKTLAGVASYALSDTQSNAVRAKRMSTYQTIAGVDVTQGAQVASGEWVDIIRGIDWFRARTRERLFGLLVANKKLPFTDAGVDVVKGEVLAQINEAVKNKLADGAAPISITAPKVSDVSAADKSLRNLPGVEFSFRLQGAIHTLAVTGTATL